MSYTKQEIEKMDLREICNVCEECGLIQNYYFFDDFSGWLTNNGSADADDILHYARDWDTNNHGYDPSDYDVIIIDEDGDPIGYDESDLLCDKLISYLEENDLLNNNAANGDKEIIINVSKAQNLI